MTRKDYVRLAAAIKRALARAKGKEREGVILLAEGVERELREDNPRFDAGRFRDAAGLPD